MTRKDFETKSFEELVNHLQEDQNIYNYDYLKEYAISLLQDDNVGLALHMLDAIYNEPGEYFEYDFSMGTLQTPHGLTDKSDIEHLIEETDMKGGE